MAARNKRSEEIAQSPDPSSILSILDAMHRQIRLLLLEMEELVQHPAVHYELFPRVRESLRIYLEGERVFLFERMAKHPQLLPYVKEERSQINKMQSLLNKLSRVHSCVEQQTNKVWQKQFFDMKTRVIQHMDREKSVIIPLLRAQFDEAELNAWGSQYKKILQTMPS